MIFQRNPSLFPSLLSIFLLIQLPRASSNYSEEFYQTCGRPFSCGHITSVGYPFWAANDPPYCGYPGLALTCNEDNIPRIKIKNMNYQILDIYPTTQTIRISREDVMKTNCPTDLINNTLDYTLFDYVSTSINLTFFYGCPSISGQNFLSCKSINNGNGVLVLPGEMGPGQCNASVIYPVAEMGTAVIGEMVNYSGLDQILRQGFDVRWKVDGLKACSDCSMSGGRCGYDMGINRTTCFCPFPPYVTTTCSIRIGASPRSPPSPGKHRLFPCLFNPIFKSHA